MSLERRDRLDTGGGTGFSRVIANPQSYRNVVYLLLGLRSSILLLRFPAGVATFTVAITLIATSLGLAFAPTYTWTSDDFTWASRTFDPFPWSFALVPMGLLMVFASLHLMNALAAALRPAGRSRLPTCSARNGQSYNCQWSLAESHF